MGVQIYGSPDSRESRCWGVQILGSPDVGVSRF